MENKFGIVGWITYTNIPLSEQLLFGGITFDTFEQGWDWIYENDPEPASDSPDWIDGWYDDYYVVKIEESEIN